jgi:hypothetical protein
MELISVGFNPSVFKNRITDLIFTLVHDCKGVAILKTGCFQIKTVVPCGRSVLPTDFDQSHTRLSTVYAYYAFYIGFAVYT